MKIEALMTKDVFTVSPDMSLKDVAALLSEKRISGAPVCETGAVVGVISEADIIRKEQGLAPEVHGAARWFTRLFDRELDKVEARTVGEAMTAPAVTVRPLDPVAKAARLLVEHRINRLPVVAFDGRLVGIVTRADLVRAFHRTDEEIAEQIRDEVFVRALWLGPEELDLTVEDGVVAIRGLVETESDARVVKHLVCGVPGVVQVTTELNVRHTERPARRSILEFLPR